jgi:hypothetical protein
MAEVMQQSGHSQQALDISPTGYRFALREAGVAEALIQRRDSTASKMHDAEDVLEAGVFRSREYPPRRLKLVDLAQPLNPGMIDNFAFRDL